MEVSKLIFSPTVESIINLTNKYIEESKKEFHKSISLDMNVNENRVTFLRVYADDMTKNIILSSTYKFLLHVHPDQDIKKFVVERVGGKYTDPNKKCNNYL